MHRSPFARLGAWAATHFRRVLIAWLLVLLVFGVFAVHVESALAGAGWQASNSQSVAARAIIEKDFAGLGATGLQVVVVDHQVRSRRTPRPRPIVAKATSVLRSDPRVSTVVPPQAGVSISRDGRTAIITAGAAADSNKMVQAADAVEPKLAALSTSGVTVTLTGDSALWADFNTANRSAMLRSEMLSWPVTIIILIIAFGSLVAAGLPLLLTMAGLLVAAGALVITTKFTPVSIWALNFALMFALALGIDYALFLVMRFRSAFGAPASRTGRPRGDRRLGGRDGRHRRQGRGVQRPDGAGLPGRHPHRAEPGLPVHGLRDHAVGHRRAGGHPHPAAGRARQARDQHQQGQDPARAQRAGRGRGSARPGAPPLGASSCGAIRSRPGRRPGPAAPGRRPDHRHAHQHALDHHRAASANARVGYYQVTNAFGAGAPGTLQVVVPEGEQATGPGRRWRTRPGWPGSCPGPTNAGWTLDQVVPTTGPSTTATGATIDHLRQVLPARTLIGGAAAENHDLQQSLASHTPIVLAILGVLGFLLLLIALGAPLIAAMGVLITALSVAGAFGIGRLIFQNGLLSGPLNFQPQGFIDAWAPLFFGAMVFGVAMDYTLFMLSAAKERYETHPDPEHAMVGSMRTSGRVVLSAAAVMIAVFLTFALSGPLAPKEMGVILAIAVALDALVVRLVVLPVLLRLGGHSAWHQPKWLGRILPKVTFSH